MANINKFRGFRGVLRSEGGWGHGMAGAKSERIRQTEGESL